MDYRNAIILVTGGSSGIGRAFVDRFLREGATAPAATQIPPPVATSKSPTLS